MESINKIKDQNNVIKDPKTIQRNTINEEEDEELDQSYGTNRNKKNDTNINNKNNENHINDEEDEIEDEDEYIDINHLNDIDDDENDFIDFNNLNQYDSENSQEKSDKDNIIDNEENENNQNENIENNLEEDEKGTCDQEPNNNQTETQENKYVTENQGEEDEINNQIRKNILEKKSLANPNIRPSNIRKKPISNNSEFKAKKFFEDKRETKTIFSKISEELIYQLSKDKYKKTSAYDLMTNDIYINRVVQKGDQENKNKFKNFVERNNEFFNKKKLRLNEKIQKISEETNNNVYSIPNKKSFGKQELRNPDKFWEDQKNFVIQKQQFLENQREEVIKKTENQTNNHIPEINKNSRNIAENKIYVNENKNGVFDRLHNLKNVRNKQQIFNDVDNKEKENNKINKKENNGNAIRKNEINILNRKSMQIQKTDANKLLTKTPLKSNNVNKNPKEEMNNYSNKLHDDAKKWLIRNEERVKKVYGKEDQDLQCNYTKILNVKKFIKTYNRNLKKLLKNNITNRDYDEMENANAHNSHEIKEEKNIDLINSKLNFPDYCTLLKNLGFIKCDHNTIKNYTEDHQDSFTKEDENKYIKKDIKALNEKLVNPNKKPKLIQKQMKKESQLVIDSWKILLSNSQKENQIEELENVDQKDILIFLCVVQGFLKGDVKTISAEEEKEIEDIKMNTLFYRKNKKDNFNKDKPNENLKKTKSQEKSLTIKAKINPLGKDENNSDKKPFDLNSKINFNKNIFSDDENNLFNYYNSEAFNPALNNTSGEFNKFKRIKSKESINKYMKKSTENMNNLDENCENKYKRKKSKNTDMSINNNNNDKEMLIRSDKFFSDEKLNNFNNDDGKMRNKTKSQSKERRSLSNKNRNNLVVSNLKEKNHNENILNEENKNNLDNKNINDIYLINRFFKFIDIKKYPYTRPIAKKIKIIFRLFLEIRTDYLLFLKSKNIKEDEDSDITQESYAAYGKKPDVPKEKTKNKIYYEKFKKRIISSIENEMTFKPEILNTSATNSNNNHMLTNKRKKLKMEDAYEYQRKKKESELNKLRFEKEQLELKDCTFQPNVDKLEKKQLNINLNSLVDKLYKEGLAKIKEKIEISKKHEEESIKKEADPKIITFKPTIKHLDETIFTNKNIEAYELSKKNVERFERARIEKKIAEIQKQTGITNLNQINNIDTLLKENNYPSWNFTLEKKLHKDTFDDTSRFSKLGDRKNENHPNIINTFNTLNTINTLTNSLDLTQSKLNNDQFIHLDVNISDDSPVKKLKINLNEDPKLIAEEFAKMNDLSEEKTRKLITLIEEKIGEYKIMHTQNSK